MSLVVSGERAESGTAPKALRKRAWVVEEDRRWDGLWHPLERRSRGESDVARGGWAEDARRPPATSRVCAWTRTLI